MRSQNIYRENNHSIDDNTINIRVEIEKYLVHWKWFLLGVILSVLLFWTYLRYTTPMYSASASIMIKDNKKSGISAELAAFEDLGIVGGSANNTDNEIEILKSRKIIGNVVDSLHLDLSYFVEGRVITRELYKFSSPVEFEFYRKDSTLTRKDTVFNIELIDKNKFTLFNNDQTNSETYNFNQIINNELGVFKVNLNEDKFEKRSLIVSMSARHKMIDKYRNSIDITPVNKNSSVLILSLNDAVRKKAEDILDELVRQYNIEAIKDKSEVSKKTKNFIDTRLEKVKSDLYLIDKDVKEFKTQKDFTGLSIEAQLAFQSLKESNQKISEAKISLTWAEEIRKTLTNESEKDEILPTSLGFSSSLSLLSSINGYNDLILQIKKTRTYAGPKNPILIQMLNQKKSLQSSLLGSLTNEVNAVRLQLNELEKEQVKVLNKVKSFPANEQGFIDISRQQEIIGGLYQYLLKKKEETDISLAVTVPNAKIIDVAYSANAPVSPNKRLLYLAALLLGLIVPFCVIYVIDLLDTKVHSKQDVENEVSVPFLGDVPKSDSREKVIIGNDVRSSSAEAFRLIRTNLDFMLANNRKESKSIFVTSTTSGEGKSFISINLAATLALSGKKVLLMGMDLRAPKVTEYLGISERKGITNYITDEDMLLEDIIFTIPQVKGLDIISSGAIPPNPAELLMTNRIDNLFTIVKQEYDMVIVDTAPVNLVTDTLLIAKYADMFMYVVRANYLDKRLLGVPQELYNEQKLPNMAIVLNDTDPKRSYGYGYGGYGYGYVVVEKPWYKKIFSKDS